MATDTQNTLRIGITGHRNLTVQQSTALEPVIKRAIENIIHYYEQTNKTTPHLVFTSPIAKGADTIFFNIAQKYFDGDLKIYLPFEKEEYLKDFDTAGEKNEFERLLTEISVTEVHYVNKISAGNRNNLYLECGKKVVDDNDYMIAVWDEQKAKGLGGTADIVAYATSLNKDVLVINPDIDPLMIKANYLSNLAECPDDQPRPEKLSDNIVDDYYELNDRLAMKYQRKYKWIWEACFRLGWVAALILSVKMAYQFSEEVQFMLTLIEVVLLSWIVILIVREKRLSYHKKYLQCRFIAERLRINNLTYRCGYYPIKSETKVIHKALQEMEQKYPVVLLNKVIGLTNYTSATLEDKKEWVKTFADSQSSYHNKRKRLLEIRNKQNSVIKTVCIWLFAAVVVFHTIKEFSTDFFKHFVKNLFAKPEEQDHLSKFSFLLYLFLPATLARFEGAKYLNDWERLITQSMYMDTFFTEISGKTKAVKTDEELYSLLTALNENMYLENLDWEMFMSNKNEPINL